MITENFESYQRGGTHKTIKISVVGEETVITNENLLSDSMTLNEAICSELNLVYGSCEASEFSISIANVFDSLEGKQISVECIMDGVTEADISTPLGFFTVRSDKPTADRVWRKITAYDAMYDVLNADVLEWYRSLTFPMSIKDFRDSFFDHLGILQAETQLINDSFMVHGGFNASGTMSGRTIAVAICELNGVFGHIGRDGLFYYISLSPDNDGFNCPPYENNSVTYEDYETAQITKITIKGSESDVGISVGTDGNTYDIIQNVLIYGSEGSEELFTALTRLLNKISIVTYRPFEIGKTFGNPCVEVGDRISVTTRFQQISSYVIRRTLTGIQALRDNYGASGDKDFPTGVNSITNEIYRTEGRLHTVERTIDSFSERIESLINNFVNGKNLIHNCHTWNYPDYGFVADAVIPDDNELYDVAVSDEITLAFRTGGYDGGTS